MNGIEEIQPVKIYEEIDIYNALKLVSGSKLIAKRQIESDYYFNLFGGGITKIEEDAFSKLEETTRRCGGDTAIIMSRSLKGFLNQYLLIRAEIYNIGSQ